MASPGHVARGSEKRDGDEDLQSPVEEVALTVGTADDPSLPVWTFRMWVLGLFFCMILAFINEFFQYRAQPMKISALSATLAALPLGRFMAAVLPATTFTLPFSGGRCRFSLNPGPFNVKEHVLISIFANAGNAFGYGGAFAVEMVNLIKIFYDKKIHFLVGLCLVFSSQLIGYGWAGLMRKQLIDPPHMWWPQTLMQVSLFRTLHESLKRGKGNAVTRSQFFFIVTIASFAYYILPGYFIPIISCASILCWIWPSSVTLNQIGSGTAGLGIGAVTLDWAAVSSFLGSPLVYPWHVIVNMVVGAALFVYVLMPIAYWNNFYEAKKFPFISAKLFKADGSSFDANTALQGENQGQLYLSMFFGVGQALWLAVPFITILHVLLFHGREIWQRMRVQGKSDIHTRLMQRYPDIPNWWFISLLGVCIAGVVVMSIKFEEEVQIPWWGVLVGCAIAAITTLPIGVIAATTNMTPSLMVFMQFVGGYLFPGNPIANQGMKLFGHMSMQQGIFFLQDFKLGHYMKIPPRSMFLVQVIGTIVAGTIDMLTAWKVYGVPHVCNADGLLPPDSDWTCPWDNVAFGSSVVWGLVGPDKMFGDQGLYKNLIYYFCIGGSCLTILVWLMSKAFPSKAWIQSINVPVLMGATGWMPAAGLINYTSWFAVGFVFQYLVYKYRKGWWQQYNYILSAGLDAGTAIMGILIQLCNGFNNPGIDWWASSLATQQCPNSMYPLRSSAKF